jgi:hypothetical protein
VVEVGGGLGLGAEAGHGARGGQLALDDHLEGDDAVEADVAGLDGSVDAAGTMSPPFAWQLLLPPPKKAASIQKFC